MTEKPTDKKTHVEVDETSSAPITHGEAANQDTKSKILQIKAALPGRGGMME